MANEGSNVSKFMVHDSDGVHLWSSNGQLLKTLISTATINDAGNRPVEMIRSSDGHYLAIIYKNFVEIFKHNALDQSPFIKFSIENVKHLEFSPKSTMIMLYAQPSIDDKNSAPNLKIFNIAKNGELIHEWIAKKRQLIQWSSDESIAHRHCGSEILFYENNNFQQCSGKLSQPKLTAYSFKTNKAGCNFVAIYMKGEKGAPSIIKIHGYPHIQNTIVSKSFFKVDTVDMKWNPKGDALLAQTSTDYDSSGQSYYGETMLHYLNLSGDTSTIVGKKEGTVSAAEWLPNNEGFIVIQGKMPSLVTWYSNKVEPIYTFGELPVNGILFNRFGSLLALTGFGNLSGNIYVWNLKTKTLISNFKAIDTTCHYWLADGLNLVTATHHDRLKVVNGFRCWDYLGTLIHEYKCDDKDQQYKLYQLLPFDLNDAFDEPKLQSNIKGKLLCEEPKQKYVPPSLRNKNAQQSITIKPPPPKPVVKSLQKQQEKHLKNNQSNDPTKDDQEMKKKKLKNLNKKLQQIKQLKKLQEEGKELEKNQLSKIEKLDEILKEIELLKM